MFDSVEEEGLKVVKRLIGMPGDTLAMEHGGACPATGKKVDEPYVRHDNPGKSESPELQRHKMRDWQVTHLVGRYRQLHARPAGLGADRRAAGFVLHDG